MRWRKGDHVLITAGLDRTPGTVILASDNGRSLMLEFDAILHGHVGMMPVLLEDDGCFRSIVSWEVIELTALKGPGEP